MSNKLEKTLMKGHFGVDVNLPNVTAGTETFLTLHYSRTVYSLRPKPKPRGVQPRFPDSRAYNTLHLPPYRKVPPFRVEEFTH